jgi:hypothetical protein
MIIFSSSTELPSLDLQSPAQLCCNCGTQKQLEMTPVSLNLSRYFAVFASEITLSMMLPFCQRCKGTANRRRQGMASRLLIALMLFLPLLLWIVFAEPKMSLLANHPVLAPLLFCIALVEICFALRRPGPKQTSAYQPVYLYKVKRTMGGEFVSFSLRFTNKSYAARFRHANKDACNQGWLKIVFD